MGNQATTTKKASNVAISAVKLTSVRIAWLGLEGTQVSIYLQYSEYFFKDYLFPENYFFSPELVFS